MIKRILKPILLPLLCIGATAAAAQPAAGPAPHSATRPAAQTAVQSSAQSAPAQLTLEECYAKASDNYPLVAQYGLIRQSEQYSLANANKGYLPQLSLSAQATWQTDVTQIPISLPGVDIPKMNKDQYKAVVELNQVIWDGGAIRSQKQSIGASSEVDLKKQEVDMYAIRERINSLYFGTLLLEEQLRLNGLYDDELARNYQKVQSYIDNGVASEADLDVVRVQQLTNRQQRAELEATRRAYRQMLGAFTGADLAQTELVKPLGAEEPAAPAILRPELELFNAQHSLLDAQDKAITAKSLPRLSFFVQGAYGRPGLNMLVNGFKPYAIGGVRLSWNFGNYYTKRNEKRQIDLNRSSVEVQRETFLFNTRQQISTQDGELEKYRRTLADDGQIIALRNNIQRASEAKVAEGTMSVTDYMDDVTAAETARQNRVLHEMQLLMSIYNIRNLTNN